MEDLLPAHVLASFRDHCYAGVKAAEIGCGHNVADEDSVIEAIWQVMTSQDNKWQMVLSGRVRKTVVRHLGLLRMNPNDVALHFQAKCRAESFIV